MIPTDYFFPERLWVLLAVPVLAAVYVALAWQKGRAGTRRAPGSLELLVRKQSAWKRHVAVAAAILSLASLVVAWSMPRGYTLVPRDRATVVIAIDVSKSMEANDVKPNRLQAAQAGAEDFLQILPPGFNVALVAFAGTASVIVPPTTDRGAVLAGIRNLQLAPSTAIGEGIYTSLDALALVPEDPNHPGDTPPAAIVLLSDGASNLGRGSATAATDAKKKGVPVYTIAYGTPGGYVVDSRGQQQSVPVDHAELQKVADNSGGKKFSAATAGELKQVYDSIAHQIGYEKVEAEITEKYAGIATIFGIIAALAAVALGARWP
jgi:Ca-activated chloride channel family protein